MSVQVAALDDLLATKLEVMLQRVESRDYRDVAAILQAGCSLARGLAIARIMFGNDFQPAESLKALTWFEGGDLHLLTDKEKQTLIESSAAVRQLPPIHKPSDTLAKLQ